MASPLLSNPSLLFTNVEESDAALADLRNEDTDTTWLMFGYKGRDKKVSTLRKGTGNIEDLQQYCDDKALLFILYGYIIQEEKFSTLKYVFISFIGPKVRPMTKARSTQHRESLFTLIPAKPFLQLQAEMQIFDKESLTEDLILEKLTGSKLHRKPKKRTHVIQKSLQRGTEKYKIQNEEELNKALMSLRNDDDSVDYVLLGYKEDRETIHFLRTGTGGFDEFSPTLDDSEVNYIVLGISMEEANGAYAQLRYIFITWIGENAPATHKARSSQHRVKLYVHINSYLQPHGEYHVLSRSDLTFEKICAKLVGKDQSNVKAPMAPKGKATNTMAAENIGKSGSPYSFKAKKTEKIPVPVADEAAFIESLKLVKDRKINHILLGYNDSKTLDIVTQGEGGLDVFRDKLDDSQVLYFILGVVFNDGAYSMTKLSLVTWVGTKVKPAKKALSSQHRVSLYNFINVHVQLTGEMQVLEPSELSEELIKKKLIGSKILDEVLTSDLTVLTRDSKGSKATAQSFKTAKGKETMEFVDEGAVVQTLKDLIDDSKDISYMVLGYKPGTYVLDICSTGTGDVEKIREGLKAADVNFVVMGVHFEEVNFKGYKFILIGWVGDEVKPLHRARASQTRPQLYRYCKTHLQLQAEYQAHNLEDLTTQKLLSKLFGSSIV